MRKRKSLTFLLVKNGLRLFYPKTKVSGKGFYEEQVIYVGNHAQMHGPICGELFFTENTDIWCAGPMMNLKEVPSYAFQDFWSKKPRWTLPFYRLLSYLIAPISVNVFRDARTIAVYRDHRSLSTFRESVKSLQKGRSLIIFPEHEVKHNHIIYDFQRKFVDVASIFYRKTGEVVSFVPFYICPDLKEIVIGEKITFSPEQEKEEERERICHYLMKEITRMAENLPIHRVVPYPNISKKEYPTNQKR